MRRTWILGLGLAALFAGALPAVGQGPPDRSEEVRQALARLPIAPGRWEGEASYRQGPGEPVRVHQVEQVESRLDGVVLLVEGTGHSDDGRRVHHAFAVLGWDPATRRYRLSAWLAEGSVVDAETSFADGVLTWGFAPTAGVRVRYRLSAPEVGTWHEEGETSRDGGATWAPFFAMTLHRADAGEER